MLNGSCWNEQYSQPQNKWVPSLSILMIFHIIKKKYFFMWIPHWHTTDANFQQRESSLKMGNEFAADSLPLS